MSTDDSGILRPVCAFTANDWEQVADEITRARQHLVSASEHLPGPQVLPVFTLIDQLIAWVEPKAKMYDRPRLKIVSVNTDIAPASEPGGP